MFVRPASTAAGHVDLLKTAPIAQLDRASGYEPGGRTFESCWAHQPSLTQSYADVSFGWAGPGAHEERALILTILDTGCRITELLSAAATDFDFDNLLLTVYGKGRKERRVPVSFDLRKVLFRWGRVVSLRKAIPESA